MALREHLGLDQGGWFARVPRAPPLPDELTGGRRAVLRAVALVLALAGGVGAIVVATGSGSVAALAWLGLGALVGGAVSIRPRLRVLRPAAWGLLALDLGSLIISLAILIAALGGHAHHGDDETVAAALRPEAALRVLPSAVLLRALGGPSLLVVGIVAFRLERRVQRRSPVPAAIART